MNKQIDLITSLLEALAETHPELLQHYEERIAMMLCDEDFATVYNQWQEKWERIERMDEYVKLFADRIKIVREMGE